MQELFLGVGLGHTRPVSINGISIARFAGGKMVEGWVNWDALGVMQQLGAVPEVGKAQIAVR